MQLSPLCSAKAVGRIRETKKYTHTKIYPYIPVAGTSGMTSSDFKRN